MNFYLLYLPFGIFISYLFLFDKNKLFKFSIFFLPFNLLTVDVGIQLTPFKIIQIIFFFLYSYKLFPFILKKSIFSYYYWYIFIIAIASFFIIQFSTDEYYNDFGFFRGKYRILITFFTSFLDIAYFLAAVQYVTDIDKIKEIFKLFLNGVFVLSVLGLLQFVLFYFFHFNLFPLIREGEAVDPIFTEASGILRINSLAGEPKDFASVLMVALLLLVVASELINNIYSNLVINTFFVLFIVQLILTFSTTGFLILPAIMFYLIFSGIIKGRNHYWIVLLLFFSFFVFFDFQTLKEVYEIRTSGRFEGRSMGFWEENNKAIIDYFEYNPATLLFGLGHPYVHLYTYKFIPEESFEYMYKSVYVAKAGFLRLLSEGGIILLLFVTFITGLLSLELNKNRFNYLARLLIALFLLFLVNLTNANYYLYFLFILYSFLINTRLKKSIIL